ncbi:MAG TPA: HEAT repeat domain-containing protein, partial [Chthoniobacteraceae bacterium]
MKSRESGYRLLYVFLVAACAFSTLPTIAQRPTPAETCEPPTPSQIAGIRAAFGDAREPYIETSEAVQRQALILCAEKGWGAALDPQEVAANLHSPIPAVRLAAVKALGQMGSECGRFAPEIAGLLKDPQPLPEANEAITTALASMNPVQLVPLLDDETERVRQGVLVACLRRLKGTNASRGEGVAAWEDVPGFVSRMVTLADSPVRSLRFAAIQALALLASRDQAAAAKLVSLLSQADQRTSGLAFGSLYLMPDHGAALAPEVASFLDKENPEVRQNAVSALGSMGKKGANYAAKIAVVTAAAHGNSYSACVRTLADFGKAGLEFSPVLVAALKDHEDPEVRDTISALGLMAKLDPSLTQHIRPFLDHPKPDFRAAAIAALGELGDAEAEFLPAIAAKLEDGNAGVRKTALSALQRSGKGAVAFVPGIAARLDDSDLNVRYSAVSLLAALGKDGAEAAPKIAERLKDKNPSIRISAVFALRRMGRDKAFDADSAIPDSGPEPEMVDLRGIDA